jgi:uncharacterized protein YjaG (DUF416 family)
LSSDSVSQFDFDSIRLDPYVGDLLEELSPLTAERRLAFAAWICERLYEKLLRLDAPGGGMVSTLARRVLDRLWRHMLGEKLSAEEVVSLKSYCENLPIEDDLFDSLPELGDALGAVMGTLEACRSESLQDVAKVALIPLDSLGHVLEEQILEGIDSLRPGEVTLLHEVIKAHPQMIAEKRKQSDCLAFLQGQEAMTPQVIEELRRIARTVDRDGPAPSVP